MQSSLRPLGFVVAFAVAIIIGWFVLGSGLEDTHQPSAVSTNPEQAGQVPN